MHECLELLDEAAALHPNMHDIGDETVHYFAPNRHHSDLSTSQLHVKYIPLLSDIPLRQRQSRSNVCISC